MNKPDPTWRHGKLTWKGLCRIAGEPRAERAKPGVGYKFSYRGDTWRILLPYCGNTRAGIGRIPAPSGPLVSSLAGALQTPAPFHRTASPAVFCDPRIRQVRLCFLPRLSWSVWHQHLSARIVCLTWFLGGMPLLSAVAFVGFVRGQLKCGRWGSFWRTAASFWLSGVRFSVPFREGRIVHFCGGYSVLLCVNETSEFLWFLNAGSRWYERYQLLIRSWGYYVFTDDCFWTLRWLSGNPRI